MAIRYLKDVPTRELAGKFICCPRPDAEVSYGWPALITKATRYRLTYRRLMSGDWDYATQHWQVVPLAACDTRRRAPLDAAITIVPSRRMLVCDTSEEAISLYEQALQTEKAIRDYHRAALERIANAAVGGTLARAAYLGNAVVGKAIDHPKQIMQQVSEGT